MAIFASTTTSGYSDPLKAYSIKALEMRQQEMQAQQAKEQAAMFTPENTQTPIQGLAQVANVAADAFKQRRLDNVAAANRDKLTGLIAGTKPGEDLSPQAQAEMAILAPDMYKEFAASMAARRQQAALFGQQDKARVEDARIAQEAAKAQEARIQERPTDLPSVQARRAAARGEITTAEADAIIKKATSAPASEQKYITDMQEKSIAGQSLVGLLDEALALTNHPKGIHAGGGAGFIQGIGESVPTRLQGTASAVGLDPETVSNTQRYNQIMGEQALNLLTQMKGASSDRDVQVNFKIVNDPTATLKNKQDAIRWLQAKVASLVQVHNDALTEAGGKVPTFRRPGGAATPAATGDGGSATASPEDIKASQANAQAAVASGKWTKDQANAKLQAAGIPGI